MAGLKYKLKNFDGSMLAIVEKTKENKIFLEMFPSYEEDTEYNSDAFYTLFSQPYVTIKGGSEKIDGGIINFTEKVELLPTDENFFDTIIADGPKLGFMAEKVG